jgi:putrescine aminotransferase
LSEATSSSLDSALALGREAYLALYARHVNPVFVELAEPFHLLRKYVRAQGSRLWDEDGGCYLDFFGGFGSLNLGHNHPKVVNALRKAIDCQLPLIHQLSPSPVQAALARSLASLLPPPLEVCFFASGGSEAVEASLKLARGFSGRKKLLSTLRGYHGRTMGALSLTGMEKYQEPFEPLVPLADKIPYGDSSSLEQRLRGGEYAAFFLEPIQGQGGIHLPPAGYLETAADLCRRHGTLLVLDEVQTGMGRTGKMFAFEHASVVPDVLVLSKSLGGGVMPLSACITTPRIWGKVYGSIGTFLLHGTTFGGNTLACVSGLAAIEALVEERLWENARIQGDYLRAELERLRQKHPALAEIRGLGLMVGVVFDLKAGPLNPVARSLIDAISPRMVTSYIASVLLNEHRIIVSPSLTDEHLIRIYPPLNVSRSEIDEFVSALDQTCGALRGYGDLLARTVRRFLAHRLSRRRG